MSGRYRLKKQAKKLNEIKQDETLFIPGILGVKIGGSKKVEVPNRPGFVYVRLRGDLSETVQAYNDKVSVVYDLPVIVVRDKVDRNKYYIYGKDTGIYNNWSSTPYLPRHGAQHSFDPNSPGADPVWVWENQFMPFAPVPSGSNGSMNLIIEPGVFYSERYDRWIYCGNTGTPSFSAYKPTGSNARAVLCYIDWDGNPKLSGGSYFSATITGTSQVLSYLPIMPSDIEVPICAVRLLSGTSSIVWDNIYNLRQLSDGYNLCACTGTSSGGSGASTFLQLTDTPDSYVGSENYFVKVNASGTALVFASGTSSGGSVTVGPNEAAFGDDFGNITSDQYFKVYTGYGYPSLLIGGAGDIFNLFETDSISLVDRGIPGVCTLGMYSYGGGYPAIAMYKSRGTESNPSGAIAGDNLGVLEFGSTWGGSGDFMSPSAAIFARADGNFTSSDGGAYLRFYVTAPSGSIPWSSMMDIHYDRIDITGSVHFYGDPATFEGDIISNNNIKMGDTRAFYIGDPDTDGSWRFLKSSGNLVFEKRIFGVWTEQVIGVSPNAGISFTIDGGGSEITTGSKGYVIIPYNGIITGWTIIADTSGSIVIDVKKCDYAGFPSTSSIAGSEKITLSSSRKNQDLSLSTWTTSISLGDILEFVVDSVSTVTKITLLIQVTKS